MKVKNKLNQKHVFLTCAIIAFLLLSCACCSIAGISIKYDVVSPSDSISLFNLLVDVVIGIFTVWGLFWAASEFAESAVKPVLRLLPVEGGRSQIMATRGRKFSPLKGRSPFYISGRTKESPRTVEPKRDPHILFNLYLENEKSRAGRHVYLVVRVCAAPAPSACEYSYFGKVLGRTDPDATDITISRQFPENLVVYQSPVYAGALRMRWDANFSDSALPKRVVLDYDIYTLDGASHNEVVLFVEWSE
jgi:hypothetical protein